MTKMRFILCQSEIEFFLDHTRYIEIFCYGTGLAALIPLRHSELKSWKRWLFMYINRSRCRRKVCEGNYAYSDEEGLTDVSAGSGDYEPEHDSES
jgi:hypothetical protein